MDYRDFVVEVLKPHIELTVEKDRYTFKCSKPFEISIPRPLHPQFHSPSLTLWESLLAALEEQKAKGSAHQEGAAE